MSKIISLTGALKQRLLKSGQTRAFVEIKADECNFVNDPDGMARVVAEAIRASIADSIKAGLAPDGSPLPMVSPATVERREYRDRQFSVGGRTNDHQRAIVASLPSPGQSYAEHRAAVRANRQARKAEKQARRETKIAGRSLKGRFTAPRLGAYDPRTYDNLRFGRESGMLADSLIVIAARGAWLLRFAMPRGKPDSSGRSAVERVFGRIGLWTQGAQNSPKVQVALRALAGSLIVEKPAASILSKLSGALNLLRRTVGEAEAIGRSVEDIGEGE
jgi:hypothetical protein